MFQLPDFRKFWSANLISTFGAEITWLALPLAAILLFDPSPFELGLLAAAGTLPYLLIGLIAGVWVDRLPRRPILISADLGRAVLLSLIPLLAWLDLLQLWHMIAIAFLSGVLTVFYDLAEEAYLPHLIGYDQLVEGNSALAVIDATAELAAPAAAAGLVRWLSAPFAIIADAFSYLFSGLLLSRIEAVEPPIEKKAHEPLLQQVREGASFLFSHDLLRPYLLTGTQLQFFGGFKDALLILFIVDVVGLPGYAIGLIYAVGSLSGLVSSFYAKRMIKRFGFGRNLAMMGTLMSIGWFFIPFMRGGFWTAFTIGSVGLFIAGIGNTNWNINIATLKQSVTPNRMQGRVNASEGIFAMGAMPLGSLLGGIIAEQIGVHNTIILASFGTLLASTWIWFSPLPKLRDLPTIEDNG